MAFVRARARFRSRVAFARLHRKQTRTGAGGGPQLSESWASHINILQISRHFSRGYSHNPIKEFVSGRVRPLLAKSGPMTVLSTKKLSAALDSSYGNRFHSDPPQRYYQRPGQATFSE